MKKIFITIALIANVVALNGCTEVEEKAVSGKVSTSASESSENGTVSVGADQNAPENSKTEESKAEKEESEEISSEIPEQTENSKEVKQEANQIIYDENGIKITYKGFSQGGLFENASFDFMIENNSDKDITVSSDKVSLNDFVINNFLYEKIGAGKKTNSGVSVYDYELEQNDIKNINKVEFNLRFIDPETYDELFTSDKITITLDENADMGGVPEGSQLIHEQDGISVYYVKNTGSTWISDDGIRFYIQNDTDKNITIRSENVTVNDFTMDMASFHANVENHKKANAIMELFSSELEENGITDINKIDFTIRCYEEDTYDDIWETDTITITME